MAKAKTKKNKWIPSTFLAATPAQVKELMYLNKYNEGKEDEALFVSVALDEKNNLSLGSGVITQKDGKITLRIKLEDVDGDAREYEVFNKKTEKIKTITAAEVVEKLIDLGLIETEQEFDVMKLIPEA